jgi:glycosyltransferase 2 family protein
LSHYSKYKGWYSIFLRYLLGAILIFWLLKIDLIDIAVLKKLNIQTVMLSSVFIGLQILVAGYRVQLLLSEHDIEAGISRCIAYNCVGVFYSLFLPGGMSGDLVRAYYFWRAYPEANKSALFGALFIDRFLGTVTMITMGLLAATFYMSSLELKNDIVSAWFVFFVFAVAYWLMTRMRRQPNEKTNIYIIWLFKFLEKIDLRIYTASTICWALVLSFSGHIFAVLVLHSCSELLWSGLEFFTVLAVAPLGFLVNALPLTPGGLGIGEKGFDLLYRLVGGTEGANSFLLARVFLFSPALIGGAIVAYHFIVSHKAFISWKKDRGRR